MLPRHKNYLTTQRSLGRGLIDSPLPIFRNPIGCFVYRSHIIRNVGPGWYTFVTFGWV